MSTHQQPTRDDRSTNPPNEPKAEGTENEHRQSKGRRWTLVWAALTFVIVVAAGFIITLVAGRTPQDRPRDVPPATAQSSILGPAGDNRNNNVNNNG